LLVIGAILENLSPISEISMGRIIPSVVHDIPPELMLVSLLILDVLYLVFERKKLCFKGISFLSLLSRLYLKIDLVNL
jgi:hypothetical protein